MSELTYSDTGDFYEKEDNYQPEEKVAILKRYLVDKIPVSDISALGIDGRAYKFKKKS